MRNPFFYFVFLCFATTFSQNPSKQKTLFILPESELMITGDTNITDFSCNFNAKMLPTNCAVTYTETDDGINFKNALLVLNNRGFDCGNKQINKDFHALLQTDEFPSLELELKKIKLRTENTALAQVTINIAGKKKTYELPVKVLSNPATCFEGSLSLDINDFGLKPPKKAFGLIKVKEEIQISFNISVAD